MESPAGKQEDDSSNRSQSQDEFSENFKNTTEESKTNKTKSASAKESDEDEEKDDKITRFLMGFSKLTGAGQTGRMSMHERPNSPKKDKDDGSSFKEKLGKFFGKKVKERSFKGERPQANLDRKKSNENMQTDSL
jgi:hypothetical protein